MFSKIYNTFLQYFVKFINIIYLMHLVEFTHIHFIHLEKFEIFGKNLSTICECAIIRYVIAIITVKLVSGN